MPVLIRAILKNDNTAPSTYLTTRMYYDKEYRVIQTNKQNHLAGADIISNDYDFADRLVKTRRNHTATVSGSAKSYLVREEFQYDHAGRLLNVLHKINYKKREIVASNVYDELDRLAQKQLHAYNYNGVTMPTPPTYLQSLDYSYNIRGWLTSVNNPGSCSVQSGDWVADVFAMQLEYDGTTLGGTAQHNGNINAMQWRTFYNGVCGAQQLYRFSYDAADRLTAAAHRERVGSVWTDPNKYNESNITYDLNGNLKTYTRQGLLTSPTPYGTMDQLTYFYEDAARPDRLTRLTDAGVLPAACWQRYQRQPHPGQTQGPVDMRNASARRLREPPLRAVPMIHWDDKFPGDRPCSIFDIPCSIFDILFNANLLEYRISNKEFRISNKKYRTSDYFTQYPQSHKCRQTHTIFSKLQRHAGPSHGPGR